MHWQTADGAGLAVVLAGLTGVLILAFAFVPRLGAGDRTLAALSGLTVLAYGGYLLVDGDGFRLPPYALAVPALVLLWLAGGLRRPAVRPAGPGAFGEETGGHGFEILESPALWAALPPPPISPAVGVPISSDPVPWLPIYAGRGYVDPDLEPEWTPDQGQSLFTPAVPASAPAPSGTECESCGRRRDRAANFCATCGAPLRPEPQPEPPVQIAPPYRLRNLHGEY